MVWLPWVCVVISFQINLFVLIKPFFYMTKISRQKFKYFSPTLFLLHINGPPDDAICNNAIYADDTTPYSTCDQTCDMWQQLEMAS